MSKRAVVAIITAFTLLLLVPAAAPAKVKTFSGRSTATGSEVRFDVKGKKNKKGQFKATRALNFLVFEEYFACYTADGSGPVQEGRTDSYPWIGIPPTDVNKKGKFSSTYSHESSGVTLQRLQFDGEIEGKKAHGTYRAQMSEGGIEFGYCGDKDPVEWKAKR